MAGEKLLIEIGLEELPASFIEPALEALARALDDELTDKKIDHGPVTRLGTPRRLAVIAADVAEKGADGSETISGPPKRAAIGEDGRPTKAGLGFARSQGVDFDELIVIDTPKGEYMAVEKFIPGRPTREVVAEALPGIVAGLPFPKSMRWGDGEFRFARPIHWLVVLLGDRVIEVEIAGIAGGRTSRGHRFNSPGPVELASPDEYLDKLEQAKVIADIDRRREMVIQEAEAAARAEGGWLLDDPELVEINTNLVEYPTAVCGRFDDQFLKLPDEVLITAMKEHQKYFAVVDSSGKLLPRFVAVNNTLAKDPAVVRQGHERVIRARLADAAFFLAEDVKKSLRDRTEELKQVVYHKQLGTSYEKVERFADLTGWLADRLASHLADGVKENAVAAAWLCKADLVSLMVGEFPSLQGVVGAAYARNEGLPEAVAAGIGEHYLPTSGAPDAPLPQSDTGALVGLADKMDTIAGMFAINKPPTGAADPFALRRAALGVIRILMDKNWSPGLVEFIARAVAGIPADRFKLPADEVETNVVEFFRRRMQNLFTAQGFDHDVVESVLAAALDDPAGAKARIEALQAFKAGPEFEEGAIAFKRLFNILKGQQVAVPPDPDRFEQDEEKALHRAAQNLADNVRRAAASGDFGRVLTELTGLKPVVDTFFDRVMVMAEDEALRANRLALVAEVADLFKLVADFSRLQTG